MNKSKIAVVGMAFRFGDVSNIDELHALLIEKKECVKELSPQRKKLLGLSPEKKYIPMSYINGIEYFDSALFGVNADKAAYMDPQQKLALVLTLEALENAGYNYEELKRSNTTVNLAVNEDYFGICCGDKAGRGFVNSNTAMTAGMISYFFDLRGSATVINSACTSSLSAICQACLQLNNFDTDLAVAGGINLNLIIPEIESIDRDLYDIASTDGHTRSFSSDADGCGMGDGAGIVLLKRLDDAMRDKNNIYAVICSSGSNSCGGASATPGMPDGSAQSALIIKNIGAADIPAEKIRFAECHASATPIGDSIEARALSEALVAFTDKKRYCAVTSIKSNFGHLNMASGIAGFIKAVVALYNNTIYPLANFNSPNPLIDFENGAIYPSVNPEELDATEDNYASVMSYGHSGVNGNVILSNFRDRRIRHESDIMLPFVLSAQNADTFVTKCDELLEYLKVKNAPLKDISFTLCNVRKHYSYVRGFAAKNKNDLIRLIEESKRCRFKPVKHNEKIIFIAADDSSLSGTLRSELNNNICENTAIQLELGKFLLNSGIKPDTIWGCRGSNAVVAVLSGQASEEELSMLYRKYSNAVFNRERFMNAVSSLDFDKCCFISLGGKSEMADIIDRVSGGMAYICYGESLAEYICSLFNCGVIPDTRHFFSNIDVKSTPLPVYPHEKTVSWPKKFHQPDLSGILGR